MHGLQLAVQMVYNFLQAQKSQKFRTTINKSACHEMDLKKSYCRTREKIFGSEEGELILDL